MDDTDLRGACLIAMPGMEDVRFAQSVIYICAHADDGAMGLIVNKPAPDIRFADLLGQLGIDRGPDMPDIRVQIGGPVERSRGFVLHSSDYVAGAGTLDVDGETALTATLDVLTELAAGRGPSQSVMALGYAGWGPGQLEEEIAAGGWLTCPADPDLLYGRAHEFKWALALRSIGVDPAILSGVQGRA